jgi:exonuclease SbcC
MRFGEERRRLEDGKPCPLCGALEHPSAGETHNNAYFEDAKQQYENMQRNRDGIQNRMRQIELRIGDLNSLIDEKTRFVDENGAILAAIDGQQDTDFIVKSIDEIEKRLSAYAQLLRNKSQAAENVAVLTARFGDVDKDVAMIDSHKRQIADAQSNNKKKQQLLAQVQGERDKLIAQRKALFGDKDANAEEAAMKKRLQQAQEAKETNRKLADQSVRALEQNSKDVSRTQTEIDTLSIKLRTDYEKVAGDAINVKNVSDDDDVTALYGRFTDEVGVLGEQPNADAIGRAANALGALISSETARLGSVRQILKANAESRQTVKTLKNQEKTYKQELEKWEKLNALIGSASGNKFSRMAQSITFDALLRFSNQSLKRMSDRYILVRDEKGPDKPLELAVIDTYQAGEKRPVSNLSGGESFIVSMALALGLSEMSSGAARIDSLFIDEGFASLDEDYLEAALQTLSALGNREGKLIGVISHVEALKTRIDVQIEVRRRSGGCSELAGPGVKQFIVNN